MHNENEQKFEEKKVLIHISSFLKRTPVLQTREVSNT